MARIRAVLTVMVAVLGLLMFGALLLCAALAHRLNPEMDP